MARLWDQMSAPMDLLWHLHQQWQPQPALLQLLQMVSHLALESHQMGIVEQLQMVYPWDQTSVQMVPQYHLQLLLPLTEWSWVQEYLPTAIVEQLQMVCPWDQTSVQMVPQYHLQLLLPPTEWSWVQEYLPTAIVVQLQMARLWDQMSAPMDLLWHLHQQWQPQPALLQLLQMVSHLALESHQMGIVEQ